MGLYMSWTQDSRNKKYIIRGSGWNRYWYRPSQKPVHNKEQEEQVEPVPENVSVYTPKKHSKKNSSSKLTPKFCAVISAPRSSNSRNSVSRISSNSISWILLLRKQ